MKREGREKRRGGKMNRVIGIMMIVMVMMGCNSRVAELEKRNEFLESIANLGKGFLDVFVTFGDMVAGAFGIKADTKKSDVGKYFTDIAKTMEKVKTKLQAEVEKNGNYGKVKIAVEEFITNVLDKIAAGAKKAAEGATDGAVIGGVVKSDSAGNSPDAGSVKSLVKGIKEIVDVVIKEGNRQADKTNPLEDDKKNIGKLFGAKTSADSGAEEKHIAAASVSVGAVTGADILKAISASNANATGGGKVKEAKDAAGLALAKGTNTENDDQLGDSAKKDAIISAGIALRAMAKDGKFIVKDTADKKTEAESAKGVAANSVGKMLSTLIIGIRDRVDSGVKKIKEELAKVKEEDRTEEVVNGAEVTSSKNE